MMISALPKLRQPARRPVGSWPGNHLTPLLVLLALLLPSLALGGCTGSSGKQPRVDGNASQSGSGSTSTLVLYDQSGDYGPLGQVYAVQAVNLVSHFGTWSAHRAVDYQSGEASRYQAVIYLGSVYQEPLPRALLDDVAAGKTPTMWIGENFWQLVEAHPEVSTKLGFTVTSTSGTETSAVTTVRYRNTQLARDKAKAQPVDKVVITDQGKAKSLADAVHADQSVTPWAVNSGRLTYLAEVPFTYAVPGDRGLVFADLLFDLLAPNTTERHRALVRLEDVGPTADPAALRAIADYLASKNVPFSVGVYVEYLDPLGVYHGGKSVAVKLSEAPAVVEALKYMVQRGGTLIAHGYTHKYGGGRNPYGVSGEDYEFYTAHIDGNDQAQVDGPVPEDSEAWAKGRLTAAMAEWEAAGLPKPTIFEFPHYIASQVDYQAISSQVSARYERSRYCPGALPGTTAVADKPQWCATQFFPYEVKDVYGVAVIPENLGCVQTKTYNQHEATEPAQLVALAKQQLVVRDGIASFFYHPMLGLQYLPQVVEGIQSLGYTFVPATSAILGSK